MVGIKTLAPRLGAAGGPRLTKHPRAQRATVSITSVSLPPPPPPLVRRVFYYYCIRGLVRVFHVQMSAGTCLFQFISSASEEAIMHLTCIRLPRKKTVASQKPKFIRNITSGCRFSFSCRNHDRFTHIFKTRWTIFLFDSK